jgi:TRAP-type mannitol/chloroaromatic compound transport system substrate-binding protein
VIDIIAQPKIKWRMSTTWTPALDVLQGAALRLAKVVKEMTGGRFQIEGSSAGQTVHEEKQDSALPWFSTVPFGMNPEGTTAWHYRGEGLRALGGDLRRLQPCAAPGPGGGSPDGRMITAPSSVASSMPANSSGRMTT